MSIGTKLLFFVLLVNLSAGMLAVALADVMPDGLAIGIEYDESDTIDAADFRDGTVDPPGVDPSSGWWIRFLDFITMGYYNRIKSLLDNTIFGVPALFVNLGLLPSVYKPFLDFIISAIYVIAVVEIFTGKKISS
jgi:hypothetical protein